jgi:nucleotidyltransferase/DNA polymerase involved in DNA repair
LDESRIARAILEDVSEAFESGANKLKIDKAMIVTNTKFSEHAKRYGECRKILQIGWSSPPNNALQDLIEEKKLHPITCLKGLGNKIREKLSSAGIVLIKNLIEENKNELVRKTGISKQKLYLIIEKAKTYKKVLFNS